MKEDWQHLAQAIRQGHRRAIGKGITLLESCRPEDAEQASRLLAALEEPAGESLRVAISGAPGVGKSTLIEALGMQAVAQGRRVGVLSVDPSSRLSGGSILGDKIRMPRLCQQANAYIRPSPAGTLLGGVARRTRETIRLLEAAGFNLLLVETVGVGQSETEVEGMVDLFVLLLLANGGDELQGIKRGIMELAEIIVINKADPPWQELAAHSAAQVRQAIHLLQRKNPLWEPQVLLTSALHEQGIDSLWAALQSFQRLLQEQGALQQKRQAQATRWMWERVYEGLRLQLHTDSLVAQLAPELEKLVAQGALGPIEAAERLLHCFANARK
ncbi:methylmalonyl Co-A mutase-associated GTPase MeaB [Candidatus Magnetaquicoccus inordinatus]|uniref:methylmalonyl Co-A mutase-associated GTPase MeaB n=1 Tax=Candidatus Magnetaquicoccus inordinatus TaxID=2496818 RepID=UPI00102C0CD7|nr:methylmalonyl Co-A mutase-associated GTPase MeaB [Candidatus Magnetaquicoccus inordinatus]